MKNFFSDNNPLDDANDNTTTIMPIFAEVEGNPDIECPGVAEIDLPILPLRNMVMYPGRSSSGIGRSCKVASTY